MKKVLVSVICLGILAWMVWQAGPARLWQNLLDWNWVLLACIAVWGIGYLLNAASFRQVIGCFMANGTSAENLTFRRTLTLTIGGYALNYVTPFGLLGGEPWRILQLRKVTDPPSANSAVIYYAMMHVLSHIVFWLIGLAYAAFRMRALLHQLVASVADVVVVAGVVIVLGVTVWLVGRWAVRKGWIHDLRMLLVEHPTRFWSALLLELASRMVNVTEYWLLLAVAFPDEALATYGTAYLVVAFSSLFANVLFFSPLQMGTREGGILLAFQALLPTLAMSELLPLAISISFATRIREFFWIAVGVGLIGIGQKRKN